MHVTNEILQFLPIFVNNCNTT